jgi:hypothetical protein
MESCFVCNTKNDLYICKGCYNIRTGIYCSIECQKFNWNDHKKICKKDKHGLYLFKNEIKALSKISGYPHFPYLLSYDIQNLIIYMTYCGENISSENIPNDFKQVNTYSNGVLNAFRVKFTGIQNQAVFSNLQVSTESLKNTDEGLRIQSDIIRDSSNNYSIPKGQSLLNVYQKQSYSSTIKIPFGNMGIQPTQYYYQDYIPLFDGLYIIYNVSHSIDADTQRLETTFKGYRLKKDANRLQDFILRKYVDIEIHDTLIRIVYNISKHKDILLVIKPTEFLLNKE